MVSETQSVSASETTGPSRDPTFQEAVQRLQDYWSKQGCAVWLPHNTEVGAGTMNPATFLRVLGPEPWNVAYVEPSIRPDDSRYGDNPNRVQRHTQYQVILKPDPGNAQELFLGSLEALGVDTRKHDVRFVEDNWESPALGAWGLGWEVWLDGMEVTQVREDWENWRRVMDGWGCGRMHVLPMQARSASIEPRQLRALPHALPLHTLLHPLKPAPT